MRCRFYQSRGFRLFALRAGAIDAARALKPEIAPTGNYDLPIRDELELQTPRSEVSGIHAAGRRKIVQQWQGSGWPQRH